MIISRSIHVAANGIILFFLMAESIVYMYHIFFIHSSVDGHLDYFHVLVIVNRSAMNIGVCVSFRTMFFSGYMPRSGIAGSHDNFKIVTLSMTFFMLSSSTHLLKTSSSKKSLLPYMLDEINTFSPVVPWHFTYTPTMTLVQWILSTAASYAELGAPGKQTVYFATLLYFH